MVIQATSSNVMTLSRCSPPLGLKLPAFLSQGSSQPTAAVASRSNAKTVLCRYHQLGRCTKGAACSYAHGEAELQATSAVVSVRQPAMLAVYTVRYFGGGVVVVGNHVSTPRRFRLW